MRPPFERPQIFRNGAPQIFRNHHEGQLTPQDMAQLAKGRLRNKLADVELALDGRLQEHHRFLLRMQIERLEQANAQVQALDELIHEKLGPYREDAKRLATVPGLSTVVISELIAEMGTDMTAFQDEARLASWAGVCPGRSCAGRNQEERQLPARQVPSSEGPPRIQARPRSHRSQDPDRELP